MFRVGEESPKGRRGEIKITPETNSVIERV